MIPDDQFEAFRTTLLAGDYNLLLGSGVSLDSRNGKGELLRSANTLRRDLCKLKDLGDTTTLSRAYSLLSESDRQYELVARFSNCSPSSSLSPLPHYLWRRMFTFNIDDVLERLYQSSSSTKQTLIPLDFDDQFEPTPSRSELHAIHLHGWVGKHASGFVFSHAEYAAVMRKQNPWMHLLSEILASESFLISGTSLNEVDLEYYLSHRSDATLRRSRGPSLLIEPYPDAATEADCRRHGLILVKATFADFLNWLQKTFPNPPSLAELVVPDAGALFPEQSVAPMLLRFFTDFRLISAGDQPRSVVPTAFLYGRAPSQDDLDRHTDIPRVDNGWILADVEKMLTTKTTTDPHVLVLFDEAGVGKTTVLYRVGHDLVRKGIPVLAVQSLSRIDERHAIECLATAASTVILLVDGLADYAEQVHDIITDIRVRDRIVVVATEREYRRDYVDLMFGSVPRIARSLQPFNQTERKQLIELYRQYGLVANPDALRKPDEFATKLKGDPAAIASCRILNDFRPLDTIIESLWSASESAHLLPYLCAVLARRCHVAGIRYSILQSIAGLRIALSDLFTGTVPLRLADNIVDSDYVVPMNAVIGERVLNRSVTKEPDMLMEAFKGIASGLAPHVNRSAIQRRSPEARLAGRLFDADKIVKPLLGDNASDLYVSCQKEWEWNARYWEQRALLIAESDLETAIRYTRHAISLDEHTFGLTTLGKLLLRRMDRSTCDISAAFEEAFNILTRAIKKEHNNSRITIHPYMTMFSGAIRFLELGGSIGVSQKSKLKDHIGNANYIFGSDQILMSFIIRLDKML